MKIVVRKRTEPATRLSVSEHQGRKYAHAYGVAYRVSRPRSSTRTATTASSGIRAAWTGSARTRATSTYYEIRRIGRQGLPQAYYLEVKEFGRQWRKALDICKQACAYLVQHGSLDGWPVPEV